MQKCVSLFSFLDVSDRTIYQSHKNGERNGQSCNHAGKQIWWHVLWLLNHCKNSAYIALPLNVFWHKQLIYQYSIAIMCVENVGLSEFKGQLLEMNMLEMAYVRNE